MVAILFPGRHHMLTKFQHDYLTKLVRYDAHGQKVDTIIFAVTSANHDNTRRNPIPLYLRALAIEKFSADLDCTVKIFPIRDVKHTTEFARYMLNTIAYQGGEQLTPKNTYLACSTPDVIALFRKLGFKNLSVELLPTKSPRYASLRPFEVINLLVKAGKSWRSDLHWREYAAPATHELYQKYNLGDLIIELFSDSLLTEDADITETRDYTSYAEGMDKVVDLKFNDLKPFVVEGKIVDAGCSTGSLIRYLAQEFKESDIIGIEATRKFYEFCKLQEYENPFVFFYRRNILDQNFKENTINTFIYSSVLHEIYSYLGQSKLDLLLKNTYKQLAKGGRIIIRDVVGPEHGSSRVYMALNEQNGAAHCPLAQQSTYARFLQFAKDFKPKNIDYKIELIDNQKYIALTLNDAYEFLSKMNYTDNWQSEMHETFSFWSFPRWCSELQKRGFHIVPGSRSFTNPYIIENHYKKKATLYQKQGSKLLEIRYPPTNMILAAEK